MPLHTSPLSLNASQPLLPDAEGVCTWARRLVITFALLIGGSNLLIWESGSVPVFLESSGIMVMRANASIAMIAAALSLACWSRNPGKARRVCARILALIVGLIGGLTAMQDLGGIDLQIDQLFVPGTIPGDLATPMVRHSGRMSLNAALSLLFIGLALFGMDETFVIRKRRFWPAPGLALLWTLPVSLALVGYLVGITKFTGILSSTNILLHTALALFALCCGILVARPERPPVSRVFSIGADGVLLRWTLPGSALILLALGWALGQGSRAGMVGLGEGTAMMLFGGLVLLSALLFRASGAVGRQENRARAAADALKRGRERSHAIVHSALDGVLLIDGSGAIVDWNPAAERIFGWEKEEVIGRSLIEQLIPPELRPALDLRALHPATAGEEALSGRRLELPASRRDGGKLVIELSINPLPEAEDALFVAFVRDITDRQAAEERLRAAKEAAESASRAKDHFVAALSHELRTPLTPVLLSAAALRRDERLPTDIRANLAMMERNIALEARLIDDLLDLTSIARGKLRLRLEPCDVHALLGLGAEIVREETRAKDISLELALTATRHELEGDPARLQQVFWNLLKNAVKFTPRGGRVAISTRDDLEAGQLLITVADNGMGFSPETSESLFQPFEQAGREGDHRFGGLGLGLSIARAIVDLHGGVIRAGSEGDGSGAIFTVRLPNPTLPARKTQVDSGGIAQPERASRSRRILLVEDHPPTLEVLSRLLRRAGHEVTTAVSVSAAQSISEQQPFEILISDIGLPDGTGIELITALRLRRGEFPAIALSGYGMEEDHRRTRDAGFSAHLVKPVDFDQLTAAIEKLDSAPAREAAALVGQASEGT
ncbi:MAG TPA: PAS domain S-box protein [Chthoniobacteraceae bacterium]